MSGFEPSLVPVGRKAQEPPRGHARMQASIRAHLTDLPRLHIEPNCNVCGGRGAAEVDRDELRAGVAAWIVFLCPRCEQRFAASRLAA